MPRPPRAIPAVDWKVYIPVDLAAKVDVLLSDPVTGRCAFGARSAYVEALVRADLARRSLAGAPPEVGPDGTLLPEEGK